MNLIPVKTLEYGTKHHVTYAITPAIKDVQVRLAIARNLPRLEPVHEKRAEPIAVVCYGPSLNDTWEKIREFKWVISCSGAHRFLIDRGIIPTWDIEVDPRPHKTLLIGTPHPDTTYLIASACHPTLFEHLRGVHVRLWHVFDPSEDATIIPPNEWSVTGGSSVGLRALTMARLLGFTDLHVFGMDGSISTAHGQHAGVHPNQSPGCAETEYNGTKYLTTTSMLEVAKQTPHEMNQMPDVKATFYGDGLVQAIMRDYVPNPIPMNRAAIAIANPETISAEYRELNRKLHETNPYYGIGGARYSDTVLKLMESLGTRSALDYGAGKGQLARALADKGVPIWEYDPAIAGKDAPPRPADIVTCFDVLEHIEPDKIGVVLDDLRRVTKKCAYLVIHTGPSSKFLADGRNAHVLQRDHAWWRRMLDAFFVVGKIINTPPLLHVVVAPRNGRSSVSVKAAAIVKAGA